MQDHSFVVHKKFREFARNQTKYPYTPLASQNSNRVALEELANRQYRSSLMRYVAHRITVTVIARVIAEKCLR